MGDFKIYQSIPEKGKIKVGSADVKKIYKGEDWVWPPEDDSYIPAQVSPGVEPYFISNVSTRSPLGSTNGFGLLKIKKIAPELFPPDGIAVGFEMINPAYPFGALPDTGATTATTDKYRICQVSDDYKYMYAWGRNPQGVQSIVRTEDFGQTWIEITDPAIYNSNFDTYPTLMTASRNGKVICVPYKDRPRNHLFDSSYYGIAISRDYGVTWEKVPDLFYFFIQQSAREISSVGIPESDRYGFGISISAGGKYIYIIKFRTLNVYRSSDFGKTFNYITISSGLSDSQYKHNSRLRSVAVSGNGKRVFLFDEYAITTRRYYASNDYGQTFGLVGPFNNPVLEQAALYSRKAHADYEGTKAIFESTDGNDEYMTLISGINDVHGSLTHSNLTKAGELRSKIHFNQGINEIDSSASRIEVGDLSSNGQFTSTILYPYYPIVLEGTTPILNTLGVLQNYTSSSLLNRYGYGGWQQYHRFLVSIPKIVNIT
jgi:hypothetical protein